MVLSKEEFLADNTSYAFEQLDLKLKEFLNSPNGVFIEAGANDGIRFSNTKIFEDLFGWTGLLIEPSPGIVDLCRSNRKNSIVVHGALVEDNGVNTVKGDFDGGLMSSINGVRNRRGLVGILKTHFRKSNLVSVPAFTLNDVLYSHGFKDVDFFSLDVEGFELQVLQGLDFNKYRPHFLLVEVYQYQKKSIFNLMDNNHYRLVENMTNFSKETHPQWDGLHDDYLFVDEKAKWIDELS